MNEAFWHRVFKHFHMMYFTPILWYASMLVTLIIGFINFRKSGQFVSLFIYVLTGVVFFVFSFFYDYQHSTPTLNFTMYLEIKNTLFEIVELISFSTFYLHLFNTTRFKRSTLVINIMFCAICITYILKILLSSTTRQEVTQWSFLLNFIELLLVLRIVMIYFYEILTKEASVIGPLISLPTFWVSSGIFIYCIISFPLQLMGGELFAGERWLYFLTFSFHDLALSILFVCIAKFFSCKAV
jgi:hypothetical protein